MGKGNLETIYGRHPVHESLLAGRRRFYRLYVAQGIQRTGLIAAIIEHAERQGIPIIYETRESLDQRAEHHQGIVAEVSPYPYSDPSQILQRIKRENIPELVLILDTLQDPQNLGTLFRTAEAVGVGGILIPPRRGAGVTPAVVSASAGASEHLWVAQGNLAQMIRELKAQGFWIAGLDIDAGATRLDQIDLGWPLALVVGSEGQGMRRLVRESCDFLIRIPMRGRIASLNASVAGSIALYVIWQARGFQGDRIVDKETG